MLIEKYLCWITSFLCSRMENNNSFSLGQQSSYYVNYFCTVIMAKESQIRYTIILEHSIRPLSLIYQFSGKSIIRFNLSTQLVQLSNQIPKVFSTHDVAIPKFGILQWFWIRLLLVAEFYRCTLFECYTIIFKIQTACLLLGP